MFSVIFPGQGSQIVGMGKELYSKYDTIKKLFKEADEILGFSISNLILQGPKEELDLTENTQPAIFLLGYSIFNCITYSRRTIRHLFSPFASCVCVCYVEKKTFFLWLLRFFKVVQPLEGGGVVHRDCRPS